MVVLLTKGGAMAEKPKGRGWHGDSEGHRRAGMKGGKASGRNRRRNK